jgi:hypothetical protein
MWLLAPDLQANLFPHPVQKMGHSLGSVCLRNVCFRSESRSLNNSGHSLQLNVAVVRFLGLLLRLHLRTAR